MTSESTSQHDEMIQYLPQPQIVAIDNKADELNLIKDALLKLGLPCIPLEYDITEGILLPLFWKSDRIRIIFLDLNLLDIEHHQAQQNVDTIADVLKTLSPEGPYFLIFWTKHPTFVKDVMKLIAERLPSTPLPVGFTQIDKNPFLVDEPDMDVIKQVILQAISGQHEFNALLAWEVSLEVASSRTLERLHTLVKQPQATGVAQNLVHLKDLLRCIAKAAWGQKRIQGNEAAAVTSGLNPLFLDYLDSSTGNDHYKALWKRALNGGTSRPLPDCVKPADLNAHCLIDSHNASIDSRGIWLEFLPAAFRKKALWKKTFGTDKNSLIEEFINLNLTSTNRSDFPKANLVRLGIVECSAACDHANAKTLLRRFILCCKIPLSLKNDIKWGPSERGRDKKHDAIHFLGDVALGGEDYLLYLNFRFPISLPSEHPLLSAELISTCFRLRSQVLTDISARFAGHTTRPGLYSF